MGEEILLHKQAKSDDGRGITSAVVKAHPGWIVQVCGMWYVLAWQDSTGRWYGASLGGDIQCPKKSTYLFKVPEPFLVREIDYSMPEDGYIQTQPMSGHNDG